MALQWTFLALVSIYSLTEARIISSYINDSASYDPEEILQKIFNPLSARAASYGLIRFEGQPEDISSQNFVTFEGQKPYLEDFRRPEHGPVKFEDSYPDSSQDSDGDGVDNMEENLNPNDDNNGQIQGQDATFENSSNQEAQQPQPSGQKKKKRRRRRRRKPRFQRPPFISPTPGLQGLPPTAGYGLAQNTAGQFYRPPRIAPPAGALATMTEALASIARHDDLQCVPRLLCEAAGGAASGSAPSKILQSISGLQPLLTLLSAYNGLGGSPLLIFGRAVLLGTGGGGAAACPPAYPACPADPERLVHYLNNHNGGFFRFFNAPQPLQDLHNQQYPQPYAPEHNFQGNFLNQFPDQQSYGLLHQPSNQIPGQQYPLQSQQPGNYLNQLTEQGYGLAPYNQLYPGVQSGYGYQKLNKYGQNHLNRKTNKNNKPGKYRIQKRIQNLKSDKLELNQVSASAGPEKDRYEYGNSYNGNRFKFPEEPLEVSSNLNREDKGFRFPGAQTNRQYVEDHFNPDVDNNYNTNTYSNAVYKKPESSTEQSKDPKEEIVYVVRGNGDPNHPEIVKLKPGEKLHR